MGTHLGGTGRGARGGSIGPAGRRRRWHATVKPITDGGAGSPATLKGTASGPPPPEAAADDLTSPATGPDAFGLSGTAGFGHELPETGPTRFRYRKTAGDDPAAPLPPLPARPAPPAADRGGSELRANAEDPAWSPVTVAGLLFAAVWVCIAALSAAGTAPATTDLGGLGHLLVSWVEVVGLVLITLSVAHVQVSGQRPRPGALAVVGLGGAQGLAVAVIGPGSVDLWGVAAPLFVFIGLAVPLAWVAGQFQSGIRRQRVEQHASAVASWMDRARRQASQTVQAAHRHDVRSMLFVIDGAGRALAEPTMADPQRVGFADMLSESVGRLSSLLDVRAEEIQPFGVSAAVWTMVHDERKAGRPVKAEPSGELTAVGRAADFVAVLRTLVNVSLRKSPGGIQVRVEAGAGSVIVSVEPAGAEPRPLLSGNWEGIRAETVKAPLKSGDEPLDLYVAARLLEEQGADLWATSGRGRFAVRLPVPGWVPEKEGA